MGKRTRAKARGQDRRERPSPEWVRGDPAELFEVLDGDADADIRLLRVDDTAAEPLRPLLSDESAGVPVALIEPLRVGLIGPGEDAYDIRIAIATKMGLPLPGPIGPPLAAGWTFGPRQGKWELFDPTGTLVARCEVPARESGAEPAWTAQALAVGQILIAYGARVGVRLPDGVPASQYDDQYRAAELRGSLASRRACAAIVRLSQQVGAFQTIRSG